MKEDMEAAEMENAGNGAAEMENAGNGAARLAFLKSYDFMKLGQAVNHKNWQAAAMAVQRMQNRVRELELDVFERQLTGIRQCILHKNDRQAKDILALVMAKRAQLLKTYGNEERN
ncbi:MAG: hypothetical protein NC341_09650 [Blautia sp.]|nr:hypothetical protein [Blautia sp.]MCM1200801.1 hypothetical protein [Bacteroides fragilis]